ncbi:MAG: excinuclease ABC subunit B [Verrucomicrobiaceae bacterium]|jgi:protein arginine kinase activator|nr:excinuclease ABC subunit B [Verrucomicrobiaceae bacterium]
MQCNFCDKKATVFLTQLVDGEMKKMCLCEECAEEKGVTDPAGFSLADSVIGQEPVSGQGEIAGGAGEGVPCPVCGFTFGKFQQVGRLGCSECYTTFSDEISRRLGGMHKGVVHVGRVPEGLVEAHARQQRLDQLRSRLEQAIAAENYEEAAGLRDEIHEVETSVVTQP